MRCDCCPLSDPEDSCPESEGKYGLEAKDGTLGCRHPRNWAERRSDAYDTALGEMGLDMGIEMSLTRDELARAIEICRHMIGLDYKRPYHRHGKAFYRAYRNYYTDTAAGNRILDKLPEAILRTYKDGRYSEYHLTKTGFAWLGRQLKITITERYTK